MKTHNEPVLDEGKLNSNVSASSKCVFNCIFVSELSFFCFNKMTLFLYVFFIFVVDTRDAETVHSLDPKQPPCPTIPSVADTLLDAGTASILQEDFQSDVVTKIHHESILDKEKSKYDTSATSRCFSF
jgi:hypothetical protein